MKKFLSLILSMFLLLTCTICVTAKEDYKYGPYRFTVLTKEERHDFFENTIGLNDKFFSNMEDFYKFKNDYWWGFGYYEVRDNGRDLYWCIQLGDIMLDYELNMKDVLSLRKELAEIHLTYLETIPTHDVYLDGVVDMKDVLELRKVIGYRAEATFIIQYGSLCYHGYEPAGTRTFVGRKGFSEANGVPENSLPNNVIPTESGLIFIDN